jgi:transposase
MLLYPENGFCLWMKRLEKETFRWPESEYEVLEVNQAALGWLLQGLDLSQAHLCTRGELLKVVICQEC